MVVVADLRAGDCTRVNTGVLVPVATVISALALDTLVTVPPPAGVAQVPSPLQKVDELAPVPLLRFATGRLPETCQGKNEHGR